MVLLDADGRVLLWGPMAETMLGWDATQAVGHLLAGLIPTDRPADPGHELLDTLLRHRRWTGRLTLRHRDGRPVELSGRAELLDHPNGTPLVLAILVENERVQAVEQDLATLDGLFTASPLGIGVFDTELRYARVNDALSRLAGLSEAELLGRTTLDVLPPSMAQRVHRLQAEVLRTGQPVTDLVVPSPDGLGARSLSVGRITDRSGRPMGVTNIVLDITERRDAQTKIERARQRLALLDDVGGAIADLLDVRRIGEALAGAIVPRFADLAGVELLAVVASGGEPPTAHDRARGPLLQVGLASVAPHPELERVLRQGEEAFEPAGPFLRSVLDTGVPFLAQTRAELRAATSQDEVVAELVRELDVNSLITVPLRARGTVLGLLVITRSGHRPAFDGEDLALAMELTARAGITLDNARLYARERDAALTLQRSLLPQTLPEQPGVRFTHRYLPGSRGTEIGGDWFDVIPLVGGRVAFVVGDATGHGLQAAAAMGRLRTAVRTLAALDLSPAHLLARLNDAGRDIAPHLDDPLMATCLYAEYDPLSRECRLAKAGHLPPVLVVRDADSGRWTARPLDLPSGAPLGVDGVPFEELCVDVPEGSVLVLYTDGLLETRDGDILTRVDELCELLCGLVGELTDAEAALDGVCDAVIEQMRPAISSSESDDLALLAARLGSLPEDRVATWTFPADPAMLPAIGGTVDHRLREWGLGGLAERAGRLVDRLLREAMAGTGRSVAVRMVYGASLMVEVTARTPEPGYRDGGEQLLAAHQARRWGIRHGPIGPAVWFELPLPDGWSGAGRDDQVPPGPG
ncbi:PAS domain S-box protein [Streptomyces sp. 8K308]|nr:PAS domain S-box protein [Streptomyces sp. 8K308]